MICCFTDVLSLRGLTRVRRFPVKGGWILVPKGPKTQIIGF